VSEYGIDSFDDRSMKENDTLQATCVTQLATELINNEHISVGGAVVEYIDEYWKGKLGIADARHPGCPDYNSFHHSVCGDPNPAFPDLYVNQGWFGLVNSSFAPRTAYNSLKALWAAN